MNKLIVVVIDGLNYKAKEYLGFLEAMVEAKIAKEYKIKAELPTLSRPLYELLLTGVIPVDSGIVNNEIQRLSKEESVFSIAKKNGLKTAAAAWLWISELYNCGKFNKDTDIEVEDLDKNINFGRFYWDDAFPDEYVYTQGEFLRKKYNPDFLLIHPMNVDDAGHRFGGDSRKYRNSVRKNGDLLSRYIPKWLEEGYQIVVTSDHGMSADGKHGGPNEMERDVPLWIIGEKIIDKEFKLKKEKNEKYLSQKIMAPLFCKILGIEPSEKMEDIIYE